MPLMGVFGRRGRQALSLRIYFIVLCHTEQTRSYESLSTNTFFETKPSCSWDGSSWANPSYCRTSCWAFSYRHWMRLGRVKRGADSSFSPVRFGSDVGGRGDQPYLGGSK